MVQWSRTCLPVQKPRVSFLIQEDPISPGFSTVFVSMEMLPCSTALIEAPESGPPAPPTALSVL